MDKVKQRPQEVSDAMHVECFLGKPEDSQKSSLMGVSLWASANKVVGVALPKSLELTTYHLVS